MSRDPEVLRMGVIGCGGIAQMMHLPFLAERPDLFSIEALADVDEATLAAVGRRYGVQRLFSDHRELLDAPIDGVLIASGGSHLQPVLDALAAGKHLLVEKPLADSSSDVERIAAAAAKTNQTLMVGYHKRYDPAVPLAAEAIGRMRDLRMVRVDVLHPEDGQARLHYHLHPPVTLQGSGGEPGVAGDERTRATAHGLLFGSVIHDLNLLRGLLGEPEAVISTELWRGGHGIHTVLAWPREVRCALSWIYLPGLRHYKEELLFLSPESRVTLTFPSPYFRHFPTPVTVETMRGETFSQSELVAGYEEAFRAELHAFHRCVRQGSAPSTSIDDALADARWLERIAEAYRAT